MISAVEKEITIQNELLSKIKWACTFSNCEPKIKNGNLRMVEKTNIAYVELQCVIIKEKLYLFFNQHEYFYISNLANKILDNTPILSNLVGPTVDTYTEVYETLHDVNNMSNVEINEKRDKNNLINLYLYIWYNYY